MLFLVVEEVISYALGDFSKLFEEVRVELFCLGGFP